MFKSRRFVLAGFMAVVAVGVVGSLIGFAAVRAYGLGTSTSWELHKIFHGCPKAVLVGPRVYEIGVIDKPSEYTHEYVIRNDGDAPLELRIGPSTCSCTLTGLPEKPLLPGEEGKVRIGFKDSHKNDVLKPGVLDRGVSVLTNDSENESILLGLIATVRRRIAASPGLLSFTIHASDGDAKEPHSAETIIYSQTWERFELSAGSSTLKGVTWNVAPASEDDLKSLDAKCGYRVCVTTPAAMPDGRMSGGIDFEAKPDSGDPQPLCVNVQCNVDGYLSWYGDKIKMGHLGSSVLALEATSAGRGAKESAIMKINAEPKTLSIERIETEPAFLQVRVVPLGEGSAKTGVYRVEVEIPRDAPPSNYTEEGHLARVRIVTDHSCFPTIELKVFFSVVAAR